MKYYIIHHISNFRLVCKMDQMVLEEEWAGDAPNFDIFIGFDDENDDSGYESNDEEEEEEEED